MKRLDPLSLLVGLVLAVLFFGVVAAAPQERGSRYDAHFGLGYVEIYDKETELLHVYNPDLESDSSDYKLDGSFDISKAGEKVLPVK